VPNEYIGRFSHADPHAVQRSVGEVLRQLSP
jgi:hypothetical protein